MLNLDSGMVVLGSPEGATQKNIGRGKHKKRRGGESGHSILKCRIRRFRYSWFRDPIRSCQLISMLASKLRWMRCTLVRQAADLFLPQPVQATIHRLTNAFQHAKRSKSVNGKISSFFFTSMLPPVLSTCFRSPLIYHKANFLYPTPSPLSKKRAQPPSFALAGNPPIRPIAIKRAKASLPRVGGAEASEEGARGRDGLHRHEARRERPGGAAEGARYRLPEAKAGTGECASSNATEDVLDESDSV